MPYVDTMILRKAWNIDTCRRFLDERTCNTLFTEEERKFTERDERAEREIIDFLNRVPRMTINKNVLRKDLPSTINELWKASLVGATGITGKIKNAFVSIDLEKARKEGLRLITQGCKAMQEEGKSYSVICKNGKAKPFWEYGDNIKRDIEHLGSAKLSGEKVLVTMDEHLLNFKNFIKEIEIKRPSDYV